MMFLLSNLAVFQTGIAQKNTVLFVVSAADTLELNEGRKLRQTGVFLNEFYLAYKAVSEAGYNVKLASPDGVPATIDEESKKNSYWKKHLEIKNEALGFVAKSEAFNNPMTLEKAMENRDDFIGLVVPGGQGLMVDLFYDSNIPRILKTFGEEGKAVGLICHAPSLLLTLQQNENPFLGFKVNAVSPIEEIFIERMLMGGKPKNRKIGKRLKSAGMNYKSRRPKANFAIKDRNLVTSQNPFSGEAFNRFYLEALEEVGEKISLKLIGETDNL